LIQVTKTFLPLRKSFEKYVDQIYQSNWLTNFGKLEHELTEKLKEFLQLENLLLTSNGTLAMQVLYKAFGLSGEVITSPFSFVATTSSLVYEVLTPRFADIDAKTFNIDPKLISAQITHKTSAILPVHVFGRCCEISSIDKIAKEHNLKLIYDAAHAFNVWVHHDGENILNYGDASILSFHATKLFHTIEGGAIVSRDANLIKECKKLINFGITGYDKVESLGINGKMNEFSAAMGLAVLENMDYIMAERKRVDSIYRKLLPLYLLPEVIELADNNYAYFPVLFKDETECLKLRNALMNKQVMTRRYFYPSLNTLNYLKDQQHCPVSENIASRILCLPMYDGLTNTHIEMICNIIVENIN
jgi:dTDP-4-amino-4,6-dideoxygalactose transaminase